MMKSLCDTLSEILRRREDQFVRRETGLGALRFSLNHTSSNLMLLVFLVLGVALWMSCHLWSIYRVGGGRQNLLYLKEPSFQDGRVRVVADRDQGNYLLEAIEGRVFLRWRPLRGKSRLKPGDPLVLGTRWFTLRQDGRGAKLRLEGFSFPREGFPPYIDLGSSCFRERENGGRPNHVVLEDSSVYLAHARVRRKGNRFYLGNKPVGRDRVTRLAINGEALPPSGDPSVREIKNGDRIRLGRVSLVFATDGEFIRFSLAGPDRAPSYRLSSTRENLIVGLGEIPRYLPDFLEGNDFSSQVKRAVERELIYLEAKRGRKRVRVKGFVLGKETPEGGRCALFDSEEYRQLSPEEEEILQGIFQYRPSKGSPLLWKTWFNRRHKNKRLFFSNELENFQLDLSPRGRPRIVGLDPFASRLANPFLVAEKATIERGLILDRHGHPLAENVRKGSSFPRRVYPLGRDLAHVVGYHLPPNGLQGGLEETFNVFLQGTDQEEGFMGGIYRKARQGRRGDDLMLTINADLQRICARALREKLVDLRKRRKKAFSGAAILLNGNGEILAVVSQPSPYDPHDAHSIRQALEPGNDWDDPLINRALHKTYPPGSTFKLILAAAALENEKRFFREAEGGGHWIIAGPQENYVSQGRLAAFEGMGLSDPVKNFEGKSLDREVTLEESLTLSLNEVFAFLALRMGKEQIASWGRRFGFNRPIDLLPKEVEGWQDIGVWREERDPLWVAASPIPKLSRRRLSRSTYLSRVGRMGIGQWEIRATPLQMARVGLTIAREGMLPQPRLIKALRNGKSGIRQELDYSALRETRVISGQVARELTEMMKGVVLRGTASRAFRFSMVRELVAGKTGTAEVGMGPNRDNIVWFVSFVRGPQHEADSTYALAVVIERASGLSSGEAAAVAREVWEEVAKREGWAVEDQGGERG